MVEDSKPHTSEENKQTEITGTWEVELFDCSAPHHLLVAIVLPCGSAYYSARAIKKFPIVLGILVGIFYYGAIGCGVYTALKWDEDADKTISMGGLEVRKTLFGAGYAGMHFLIGVVLLRGWVRAFYGIPGGKLSDAPVGCFLSCCALAQMSKHVAKVKTRASDTLPAYLV
uniref:Uncharacterized protein n=1 Tax=Globisporangium ultimum (strain ATCC 200006 / CBS 805.95 / DAOM BR144) TaxID=431595 RepID=K3WNL6_GLOUD